jgi:predicted AAA+ superfamily ATPase
MVFLAGPREVGKTRLARHWLAKKGCMPLYFIWDDIATRQTSLKFLDREWSRLMKGFSDTGPFQSPF